MTDTINGLTPEQRLRAFADGAPSQIESWEARWAIEEIDRLRRVTICRLCDYRWRPLHDNSPCPGCQLQGAWHVNDNLALEYQGLLRDLGVEDVDSARKRVAELKAGNAGEGARRLGELR